MSRDFLNIISREQVRAGLREPDESAASVHLDPAALYGVGETGLILGGRALDLEQERPVDLLNVDAPVLNGFAAVRDLDQFAYFCCRSDSGLGSTNSTKSFSTES